jgi:hypothetical protein
MQMSAALNYCVDNEVLLLLLLLLLLLQDLVTAGEVVSLNHIRDTSGQRNISLVREGTKFSCAPDQVEG